MRITPHIIAAAVLLALAAAIAVPPLLDLGSSRAVTSERLTVPPERVRQAIATADRALGPVVQAHAGAPRGNPFALRERGATAGLAVPEPPPPPLAMPEPPPTPFAPAGR